MQRSKRTLQTTRGSAGLWEHESQETIKVPLSSAGHSRDGRRNWRRIRQSVKQYTKYWDASIHFATAVVSLNTKQIVSFKFVENKTQRRTDLSHLRISRMELKKKKFYNNCVHLMIYKCANVSHSAYCDQKNGNRSLLLLDTAIDFTSGVLLRVLADCFNSWQE